MTVQTGSRSRAVSAFVVIVLTLAASFAGCTDRRRSYGEECLKDDDCLSNVCIAQRCASTPPLLEGNPPPSTSDSGNSEPSGDAASDSADAGSDSGSDSSDDGPPAADASDDVSGDAETVADSEPSDVGLSDVAGDVGLIEDASPDVLDARLDVAAIPDVLGG